MIVCSRLVKEYGGFRALDGIEFEAGSGRIFAVIGHNGAGKTTLLKIMAGLLQPTSGSLLVDGIDVVKDPIALKRILGYLPEESRLYDSMTVRSYLAFFAEIYGLDRDGAAERMEALLEALSMKEIDKRIGELSKGMRRKVAIARSLLHDPSILVYDEPASGLDPMTSRFIAEFLRELRKRKKTIVMSAHNLHQVEEICDTVMILRRGRVAALGTMDELRAQFGSVRYTILFSLPEGVRMPVGIECHMKGRQGMVEAGDIESLNQFTTRLIAEGARVERIETRYPTLEEMLVKVGA